eukprot:290784_1
MNVHTKKEQETNALLDTITHNESKCFKFDKKLISLIIICGLIICTTLILVLYMVILNEKDTKVKSEAGLYGLWGCYGGNPENQQIAPQESEVIINEDNIKNVSLLCTYDSIMKSIDGMSHEYSGYVTIDENNRGYITDGTGHITCIDLNSCTEIWSVNAAHILGYDSTKTKLAMRNTATLFTNSHGTKGIIFGTPNIRSKSVNYNRSLPCYAVALNIENGSLLFSTILGEGIDSDNCQAHGFMVPKNEHYGYGGMGSSAFLYSGNGTSIKSINDMQRGKMFKIDLDNGRITNIFHTIDTLKFGYNKTRVNISDLYHYRGASAQWNYPAIIDNYLVFGTANLLTVPKYVDECLLGNYSAIPLEYTHHFDACGNDRSLDSNLWRCLEKGIYTDSFMIFNKNSFEPIHMIPVQGADVWCNNGYSTKFNGPDSDLVAVAAYRNNKNGKLYGAAMQKSGHFYVFNLQSGKAIIAKKVGKWSTNGGGRWGIAVDSENMIAVTTITGGGGDNPIPYRYEMADGTVVCNRTGSVHAIDLHTGYTIWQIYNPYGTFGYNNCSDSIYDDYIDIAMQHACERDVNGNPMKNASETASNNVYAPPIDEDRYINRKYDSGLFVGPVTISGNMVFIPSYSGHVFVHNLFSGIHIFTLSCPQPNEVIKGGITIVQDRIIFYCGISKVISMKLNITLT